MKIQLTEEEINLKATEGEDTFEYKLNGTKVEEFKSRSDALKHAQYSFRDFITEKYLK